MRKNFHRVRYDDAVGGENSDEGGPNILLESKLEPKENALELLRCG